MPILSTKKNKFLLVVLILILATGIGFWTWKKYSSVRNIPPAACSRETKLCPDGSSVVRGGQDCEFSPCPPGSSAEICISGNCATENENALSGFKNSQVEKAIRDYLLTQEKFSWKTKNESFNFCAVQNLDPKTELFPYYVWIYCAEYGTESGKLILLSGTSLPAKIDYPNELSFYDPSRFTSDVPRDGSFNDEDIERIFPEDVRRRFSDFDREGMIKKLENNALEAILSWEAIKLAIAECRAAKSFQSHSGEVVLDLKDGSKLAAVEPNIDDIVTAIDEARAKCGDVVVGTE